MTTIADRIKEGLSIRNMRQTDIIEETGINKGALSSYISGKYEPKQGNIYKLAKALNVSEAWLMGYDVPMNRINISDTESIPFNKKDEKDIAKRLEELNADLENQKILMLDGEVMDTETRELIKAALASAVRISKIKAKEKYNPNKNK